MLDRNVLSPQHHRLVSYFTRSPPSPESTAEQILSAIGRLSHLQAWMAVDMLFAVAFVSLGLLQHASWLASAYFLPPLDTSMGYASPGPLLRSTAQLMARAGPFSRLRRESMDDVPITFLAGGGPRHVRSPLHATEAWRYAPAWVDHKPCSWNILERCVNLRSMTAY